MYTKSKGIYKKKATKFNEGFLGGSVVKNLLANAGDMGWIPRLGKTPGEGNGTHCSIFPLEIPWTEELCQLPSSRT